jgi:F-type H+-transporting ATPase subunit delta
MVKVIITTASKLEAKSVDVLRKALEKSGKKAEFELRTDPTVIGGIKIVMGSKAIDMTVAGKLSQVKKQLLAKL